MMKIWQRKLAARPRTNDFFVRGGEVISKIFQNLHFRINISNQIKLVGQRLWYLSKVKINFNRDWIIGNVILQSMISLMQSLVLQGIPTHWRRWLFFWSTGSECQIRLNSEAETPLRANVEWGFRRGIPSRADVVIEGYHCEPVRMLIWWLRR